MKVPVKSLLFIFILLFSFGPGHLPKAEARIGEGKDSIERRLFASGGLLYRDDEIEAARQKGMPYLNHIHLLPSGSTIRIYFKTDDGSRPQSSELNARRMPAGWDLHVVYLRGKSAIEVYKRSRGISPHELNELLARQAGGSFWKKIDPKKAEPSAFGYQMERDDGRLRAKRIAGDSLMIFDAEMDTRLAEERESDLVERAPVSVEGF